MTGKPEILTESLNKEENPAALWEKHYPLLKNHFSSIEPPSWYSLHEAWERWRRQHPLTSEAMHYRLERALELINSYFPQEVYFSFFLNPEHSGYGVGAIALTETWYGPFPYAFPFFTSSELEVITGTSWDFLGPKIAASVGIPTFFLSPFFKTREGPSLTLEGAKIALPPLKQEIIEKSREEAGRILTSFAEVEPTVEALFAKYEAFLERPQLVWRNTGIPFLESEEEVLLLQLVFWARRAEILTAAGIRRFSEAESKRLQATIAAGEQAAASLLIDYMPLIIARARKNKTSFFTFSELTQQGVVGFQECLKEINPEKIDMFSLKADTAVRKAINSMVGSGGVGIGKTTRHHIREVARGEAELTAQQRRLVEQAVATREALSLEDLDKGELLSVADKDPVWTTVEERALREELADAFSSLTEKEQSIMREIFLSGRSLQSLVQSMGFKSRTSVWEIQKNALRKLRSHPGLSEWLP